MKSKEVLRLEGKVKSWRRDFFILWIGAMISFIIIGGFTIYWYSQANECNELINNLSYITEFRLIDNYRVYDVGGYILELDDNESRIAVYHKEYRK